MTARRTRRSIDASRSPAIYFDVSDLLLYVRNHTTLSGIQRVECEIMRNLLDPPRPESIRLVALDDAQCLGVVETPLLRDLVAQMRSGTASRGVLDEALDALRAGTTPLSVRPGDLFLTVGAFWGVSGIGSLFQDLKNRGVIVGVLIHDIISITDPEYFDIRDTRIFVKGLVSALTFADFLVTTSEYNKASLTAHIAARNLRPLPVHVVPLAHELSATGQTEGTISRAVADIAATDYVLCVGTIEARKNPTYLFNIWRLMVKNGRASIPTLVFVGRKGWLVQDFMEQVKACNHLDGRIAMLHDVTDVELDLLYRKCMLTMFPSVAEGWGLPVGESLSHGKISIASRAGAIPEAGGEWVDYIDPYNASDGLELLSRYLDDPGLRHRRASEIARHFEPRRWRQVADDFLRSAQLLARQVRPLEGPAAIKIPSNLYLPISNDPGALTLDGIDGGLSADLICVSGWRPPEAWGAWAAGRAAMLQFRADVPAGTRIHLVMRLRAGDARSIRIASGSGSGIDVPLTDTSDRVATLSCEVEPGDLVSVRMSVGRTRARARTHAGEPLWGLRGILYFRPDGTGRDAPPASPGPARSERAPSWERVQLRPAPPMDDSRQAKSLGVFRRSANCYWPSRHTIHRHPPIFADHADEQIFSRAQGRSTGVVTDLVRLIRRSDQYVSMWRFSEGSVFDRSGVSRAFGYLEGSPLPGGLSKDSDGLWVDRKRLAAAPRYDKSYLVFYNGNLHNYYHWMTEGLLLLDVLSRAVGPDPNVNIALPKSMDIAAVLDHRASLGAVGLDRHDIVEVGEDLIRVREAIWIDSDQVQSMPAPYLRDFRQRVAARYASVRGPRNKRLLIARKGPTRKIANLEQVQALLARYDFDTVYLEGMSVADQILLFQRAEFIISPHGAGLANLLFCEPGTRVIEFMPAVDVRPFFWLISEKLGLVHGVQFCPTTEGRGFQGAVMVDIRKFRALYRLVDARAGAAHRAR